MPLNVRPAAACQMSALPPKADIPRRHLDVRFGPKADIATALECPLSARKNLVLIIGSPRLPEPRACLVLSSRVHLRSLDL
jgi:hypothetical protein